MNTTTEAPQIHNTLHPTDDMRIVPAGGNGDNIRASWRYSLDAIRRNNAHCENEAVQTMIDVFMFCTAKHTSMWFKTFCARVGYDSTSVDQMFRGKYKPVNEIPQPVPAKFLKEARAFLELERERTIGGRNEFVMTPTAKRVFQACDIARESQTPVFLYGPSQLGKTWALMNYQADHNHGRTVYVRMEAASGLGGMVKAIAKALRISPNGNTADLKERISHALTPDMVLIVDEMHLLQYTYRLQSFFACVEVLREFYDASKCGMVLCGTDLLSEKMELGKDREMQQVLRRGVHRFRLPKMPTTKDVEAILEHWGLTLPEKTLSVQVGDHHEQPFELLRMLAKTSGLKAITERLRYARKLSAKEKKPVRWEHFVRASLIIDGESQPGNGGW